MACYVQAFPGDYCTLTHYHLGILSHDGGNVGKSHELRVPSLQA